MYSKAIIAPAGSFFSIPLKLFVVKNNTANNLLKKISEAVNMEKKLQKCYNFFLLVRFKPITSCMIVQCSTDCATVSLYMLIYSFIIQRGRHKVQI